MPAQPVQPILKAAVSLGAACLALLALATTALADPPTEGTVYEGQSVPGAALGITRADVVAAWGAPSFCQSVHLGDRAFCSYNVQGIGQASVLYVGADGGHAMNSPDDVVFYYSWSGLNSWVTTAGVNTDLVLNDPDAAVAAYPDADFLVISGPNYHLRDSALRIEFTRTFNPFTGVTSVLMTIFVPTA